jgi:hypothetical protein
MNEGEASIDHFLQHNPLVFFRRRCVWRLVGKRAFLPVFYHFFINAGQMR